ncbi:MAG: DNA polymerase III subunit delta [Verrucomicrobiota bacterium]
MAGSSNLHLLTGSDDAQVREAAARLVKELTPAGAGDFGVEVVDGNAENAEAAGEICYRVIEALQTLPFFGQGKVVWLKNANFLGDSVTARSHPSQEGQQALLEVLEAGLPGEIHFVISADGIDKRRVFYKRWQKEGELRVFDLPDTSRGQWMEEVMTQVAARAEALGLEFSAPVLEYFVAIVGEKTRQIQSELEKLDLFLGEERQVSREAIRAIVASGREGVIFDLGAALARREAAEALALLDELLEQGESAISLLLAGVVPKVRSLLLARDLLDKHALPIQRAPQFLAALKKLPEAATAHLPKTKNGAIHGYPLFFAARDAERFTVDELKEALIACAETNRLLVTTSHDPKHLLSRLLVGIANPIRKRRAA